LQKSNSLWHHIWNTFVEMKKHITAFLIAAMAIAPSIFAQEANQEAP
jgi:hypothetical protein